MLDKKYKSLFNIFDNDISYFDYAATTFMPKEVINKWVEYQNNTSVFHGKGKNILSKSAQYIMEDSENKLKNFFGLNDDYDFIYGKNTTELINIIAMSISEQIKPMDYILVGPYEHHSNYLPWKYIAKKRDAIFIEIPVDAYGNIDFEYIRKISKNIKIVSISSVANTNGYTIDINKLIEVVGSRAYVFVDESQKVAHSPIITNNIITGHFLSSHKMYGPKNIAGALIKKSLIENIEPIFFGGGMVNTVGFEDTWAAGRTKFEAGTMDIGSISAWAKASEFIERIGFDTLKQQERYCFEKLWNCIEELYDFEIINNRNFSSNSLISFVNKKYHSHDIECMFSKNNIIIRSGNLCSQNSIRKFNNYTINRISFGIGVCEDDLKNIIKALREM